MTELKRSKINRARLRNLIETPIVYKSDLESSVNQEEGKDISSEEIKSKAVIERNFYEEKEYIPRDEIDEKYILGQKAVLAVKNNDLPALEDQLDLNGIPVDTKDEYGNTLFILSCQGGNKRIAKFLLRRGADINTQNNKCNTALHYLHAYKHLDLARYLLGKGADDGLVNIDGLTCYEGLDRMKLDDL